MSFVIDDGCNEELLELVNDDDFNEEILELVNNAKRIIHEKNISPNSQLYRSFMSRIEVLEECIAIKSEEDYCRFKKKYGNGDIMSTMVMVQEDIGYAMTLPRSEDCIDRSNRIRNKEVYFKCDCGITLKQQGIKRHLESKNHKKYIDSLG